VGDMRSFGGHFECCSLSAMALEEEPDHVQWGEIFKTCWVR
jgi:hypothetical protein